MKQLTITKCTNDKAFSRIDIYVDSDVTYQGKEGIDGPGAGALVNLAPIKVPFRATATIKIVATREEQVAVPVDDLVDKIIQQTVLRERVLVVDGSAPVGMDFPLAFAEDNFTIQVLCHVVTLDAEAWYNEMERINTEVMDKRAPLFPDPMVIRNELESKESSLVRTASVQLMTSSQSPATTSQSRVSSLHTEDPRYLHVEIEDGTRIICEEFWRGGARRWRQVQCRIPMATLQGKFKKKFSDRARQGEAAFPVSILSGWGGDVLTIDNEYNAEGLYEKGHLMPSSAGAPYNCFLVAPMHQYINKKGAWKQVERHVERLLYDPQTINKQAKPKPEEQDLATLLFCCKYQEDSPWEMYMKCRLLYQESTDPRIPYLLHVSLHRACDHLRISDEFVIPHTEWDINVALGITQPPSVDLQSVFELAERKLHEADLAIGMSDETPQNEWESLDWEGTLPPLGIPEAHVPRPYRALDFLLSQPKLFKVALKFLKENGRREERKLLKEVAAQERGLGLDFTYEQRKLAVLFNKYRHEGKFLSDLKPSSIASFKDVKAATGHPYSAYYTDPIGDEELSAWGGHRQAHADHHVPKSTGSGSNHFTNLLYVSKSQNLGQYSQTKPARVTNPVRAEALFGPKVNVEAEEASVRKPQATTGKATVTRCIESSTILSRGELVDLYLDEWRYEQLEVLRELKEAGVASWQEYLAKGDAEDDVPWSERYF